MSENNQQEFSTIKSNEIRDIDFYNVNQDLPNEKWEALHFFDKPYEISNYGRLKSYAVNKQGTILKNRTTSGYLTVILTISKKKLTVYIHKLVAEYFVKKDDDNRNIVIHLDNDKKNNYYQNLKWVNPAECFYHAEKFNEKLYKNFRQNTSSNCKINRTDVTEIRKMLKEGISQSQIAKKFKISEMQVTRIKRNENWI